MSFDQHVYHNSVKYDRRKGEVTNRKSWCRRQQQTHPIHQNTKIISSIQQHQNVMPLMFMRMRNLPEQSFPLNIFADIR